MNKLKAYCRRVILTAAREYAGGKRRTPESTAAAFRDAMRGTDTGWWNDLIYTTDMLELANRYRHDIREAVLAYLDECGEGDVPLDLHRRGVSWRHIIAATADRYTFADYTGDNGELRALRAAAALHGLRTAVDYLTIELAAEHGV